MVANSAVFVIDGVEVDIARDDEGVVSMRFLNLENRAWTSDEWVAFAARVRAAIDGATPIVAAAS